MGIAETWRGMQAATWAGMAGLLILANTGGALAQTAMAKFGPQNPFYSQSALLFHAPPFDRIHDSDYEPALEAGMAEQLREIEVIAKNSAPPTFANTLVPLERSGALLRRVRLVFEAVTQANSDPALLALQQREAPLFAAHQDAITLNTRLFSRIKAVYEARATSHLDPEQQRLVEVTYRHFVKAGAELSASDKKKLKELNAQASALSAAFLSKLLAAANAAAYSTRDAAALAGLTPAQLQAAADAARSRSSQGYVLPLQNTTQQPDLAVLSERETRHALFEDSWNRAERGGTDDTRSTIAQLAKVRAEKAQLLGFPNYAAWELQDQMAKTPEAALRFMQALVAPARSAAAAEASEIQQAIQADGQNFRLEPWDWNFYAEQVRKTRYDLSADTLKPYFEINTVLQDGVFYAAHLLYGITFKERHDIPVYHPDVRVFEVFDTDGKPLALFYCDYWKRDNKQGGAWESEFVPQSKLLGTLPVVYNVANFAKPAPGQPQLITFEDVTTMFHEFGHALHSMFADTEYPSLSGTSVPRDFVEFPSQFNEHWATYPEVFAHYARDYQTGAPMPASLRDKMMEARNFNQGYALSETLAAAELDMQWHTLPASAPVQNPDVFETQALERANMLLHDVPPRYRSSYFLHIWANGYAAGYYAYLWSEMLDDDAFQWFQRHGGLTRANGDRFRRMVLSRGNTEDLQNMYEAWLGAKPSAAPILKFRGLTDAAAKSAPPPA